MIPTKAAGKAPSLAPFYARVNALIAEYHDALCEALGVDPDIAKKAEADDLNALAEKYYELALELGVDEAEAILKTQVSAGMAQQLTDYLESALDDNAGYIKDSLLPAIEGPSEEGDDPENVDPPLEGKALVNRAGMYADQLFPVAHAGLLKPLAGSGLVWIWELDPASDHCDDCPDLAAGGPYSDLDGDPNSDLPPLPTMPGAGDTACLARCRCTVAIEQASWEAYDPSDAE